MTYLKFCALLVIFYISNQPAQAVQAAQKPRSFCEPGEKISRTTASCLGNRVFVDYADQCLDKLLGEINARSIKLGSSLNLGNSSQQKASQNTSKLNYSQTVANLAYLITLTNLTMDEVDEYADFIRLPVDTNNPDINSGNPEAYAEIHPCYSETRDSLDDIGNDLDDVLNQLTEAKKIADAAFLISSKSEQQLNTGALTTPLNGSQERKSNDSKAKDLRSGISGKITTGKSQKVEEQEQGKK